MSGAPASHCDFWLPFSIELSGCLAASEAMKRRGRYGPVRGGAGQGGGGAAGCDAVACFYREYLYSGSTRLLRSQTELRDEENVYETLGWEGGRGRELFCVWVFVHCQRINKKKWRSSLSFTNTTWGRERRRGLQLWFYSEIKKKKKKWYSIWATWWCSGLRRSWFRFWPWDISVWSVLTLWSLCLLSRVPPVFTL